MLVGGIIFGVTALSNHGNSNDQAQTGTPTSGSNGFTGTVDPNKVVLQQSPSSGPPPSYGSLQVFDACTLLKDSDLNAVGLSRFTQVRFEHSSIEGNVPADKAVGNKTSYNISECIYPVPIGKSYLNIFVQVQQAPFNDQVGIDLDRDVPAGAQTHSVSGITWYHAEKGSSNDNTHYQIYLFDPNNKSFSVEFSLVATQPLTNSAPLAAAEKLANQIATNIAKGPQGVAKFAYVSPFQNVPQACSLATADVLQRESQAPDWQWSQETDYQTATGSPLLETDCMRLSDPPRQRGPMDLGPLTYYFTFKTYKNAGDASNDYRKVDCADKDKVTLNVSLGDESPCVTPSEGGPGPVLHFRVGRIVATTSIGVEGADPTQMGQYMVPAAQALVPKLHY